MQSVAEIHLMDIYSKVEQRRTNKNKEEHRRTSSVDAMAISQIWNYHPSSHPLTGVTTIVSKKTIVIQVAGLVSQDLGIKGL